MEATYSDCRHIRGTRNGLLVYVFFFLVGLLDVAAVAVLPGVDDRDVFSSALISSSPRFWSQGDDSISQFKMSNFDHAPCPSLLSASLPLLVYLLPPPPSQSCLAAYCSGAAIPEDFGS